MKPYDHKKIEGKWQKKWERSGIDKAKDFSKKPKWFSLIEFPFPSGEGMHTGHLRSNTAMDIISRKRRAEGFNVLYPIGWDAFGLPTENYAIKTGQHPKAVTKKNTDNFRKQLKSAGFSFDWSREVNTSDPNYYRWTQWIFLEMYKKGLAYKKKMVINWCPKDKIGLANEEVINGTCERCGTQVEKREKEQWMLAITKYADRLDKDLDTVNFLEKIKIQQRNWIGRSEGAELEFKIKGGNEGIAVFTTRADTLFGVTYVVLAPEHELVQELKPRIKNFAEVEKYVNAARNKEEAERTAEDKEKTGVELKGIKAINPANGEEVPVFVADYVLAHYGTGAVMAVPAHDERDYAFAKKYNLPIKEVVIERMIDKSNPHVEGKEVVFRDAVIVAVRDPKNGKYLCLRWKKHPWTTFVMGGIEKGEEAVDAALREIREETGYKNVKLVKQLRDAQSEFFAAHKNVNRVAHTRNLIFELINDEREEISTEENDTHELVWQSVETILKNGMTHSEMPIFIDWFSGSKSPAFVGNGVLIDSGSFTGMDSEKARTEIAKKFGKITVTYKLRDWVFSRQRYWGEPIPMVKCEKCGWVPVPEKELPITLPNVKNYQPTDTGESPLAAMTKWVNIKCPQCKGKAQRETDTMPNWAGSSWYFLRYVDPKNKKSFGDKKKLDYWMPVDWYNGGMEHTTLHLLYSRFWHKFLFDLGLVSTSEPYAKRTSHGLILAEGGEKMSKSKGNVVNPDPIIKQFGADTLRLYEMFMGPFDQAVSWSMDGIIGPRRFLERFWKLQEKVDKKATNVKLDIAINKAIKKVSEDIESMQFNTAVSALMILTNEFEKVSAVPKNIYEIATKLLSPFAPHIAEEIWANLGHKMSIHLEKWPVFDPAKLVSNEATIVVQVNGKVRGQFSASADIVEKEAIDQAKRLPEVTRWIEGKEIKKAIYVKGKLVNIVV